jgi:pimeloyl-ACP methyl ester carboxylesterase
VTEPSIARYDAPDAPGAVVVMLHGGKPRSREPVGGRSASWRRSGWMARSIAGRAHALGASVWLARYRERGWHGGAGPTQDARWVLERVREAHGHVPVVLLGHSMGARVAVHVADDPAVVGVVGLAPWWSGGDPVATLRGRGLVAAHGRRDRITSFAETASYVARARSVTDRADLVDMGPLGHYMLRDVGAWNDVAISSVERLLADHRR